MFPVVVVDVHLLRVFFATNKLLSSCGLAVFGRWSKKGTLSGLVKLKLRLRKKSQDFKAIPFSLRFLKVRYPSFLRNCSIQVFFKFLRFFKFLLQVWYFIFITDLQLSYIIRIHLLLSFQSAYRKIHDRECFVDVVAFIFDGRENAIETFVTLIWGFSTCIFFSFGPKDSYNSEE